MTIPCPAQVDELCINCGARPGDPCRWSRQQRKAFEHGVPEEVLNDTFGPIETLRLVPRDCQNEKPALPPGPIARKAIPVVTGVLDYFPDAIAAVAEVSRVGNEQHNPGEPMHWARGKSMDQADCIGRHLIDRGKLDVDGLRHSAKVAWRALALLQLEIEDSLKSGA
jgi:hypothetical protein